MLTLRYYYDHEADRRRALAEAKGKSYDPEKDSGLVGVAFELAIKDFFGRPLIVSPQGHTDIRIGRKNYELKTGAGELGNVGGRLIKGSGSIIYVPVVLLDSPVTMQDGYVMNGRDFLDCMTEAGALRTKDPTSGERKITIQTFWVRSKNKPHGKLLDKMLEAFESYEYTQLCDFLDGNEAED